MSDLQDFVTHLEFAGYEVEAREHNHRATHDRYLNFLFKEFRGGVLVTIMFAGSDHAKSHLYEFKDLVNDINMRAGATRSYVDGDGDFMMEGYYPLPYNRTGFANFLEAVHADEGILFQTEGLRDFFD
jgi:hypothetical protein